MATPRRPPRSHPAPHTRHTSTSGHVARKRFGQHFLTDAAIIDHIVRAIAPSAGQTLVEIGPGLAALTQPLAERAGTLTVVELDRDLAARLRQHPQLHVVESDVLKVDFTALATHLGAARLRICGNLPYNISTPILFHLLPHIAVVQDQHFMLQKEVIDRMVAPPCTAAYGRLSVMLQAHYDMDNILFVPPESFAPPPRVNSAVIRMTPRPAADTAPTATTRPTRANAAWLERIVHVAFSQRRKLLRHTLGAWLETHAYSGTFDLQRRAEEIPVDEYLALARTLQTQTGN